MQKRHSNQGPKGGYSIPDDEIEDDYVDDAFDNNNDQNDEDVNDEDVDAEEEMDNGADMEGEVTVDGMEEDQEAETVEMNGVAAARGRRLKKAGQNDEGLGRGTPGNPASNQPYEAMPILGGAPGQSRLNPLQGSSNSAGVNGMGGNSTQGQQNKMRPASAKSGLDQHYSIPQQQQVWGPPQIDPQQQYSYQQMPIMPAPNQQPYMTAGYQGPYAQSFLYGQGSPQGAQIMLKKRPITANRFPKNNNNNPQMFNKKLGFPNKNPSTLDLEVSRMRPKNIKQERERLYDDALRQKMIANLLKDENIKLKTKIHILESEIFKKERLVDDLLLQQDTYQMNNGMQQPKITILGQKVKLESHLTANLKRKIKELQAASNNKQQEVEALKRHIKSTKIAEIEVEMKLYIDECTRLRQQLEEVIRSKDTFADPQEVRIIEERFQQQDLIIANLRNENSQLAMALGQRDEEIRIIKDQGDKQKKGTSKENQTLKKKLKDKERELVKLRTEVQNQKNQNEEFRSKIEELVKQRQNLNNSNIQYGGRPSTSSNYGNEESQKVKELNGVIQQLQGKLQDKQNELQRETNEKQKFKDLYEKYQGQVAQLQAQVEEGGPRKGEGRISSASQKAQRIQSAKPGKKTIPIVDTKQLEDIFLELKLKLQAKGFYSNQIKDYFFKPYSSETQVSIKKLRDTFEFNGFNEKKSEILARYLIEPRLKQQIEFDEERTASQRNIIATLEESVGHYKIYGTSESQNLIKRVQKLLAGCRDTLKETLELEDYEEEGAIPVTAFKESFQTLDISFDQDLLDFIFYVIYQKSESIEKMRYSVLFDLIDGKLPGLNATSSEGGRKRPESSSPEKLKARNKEKFSGMQNDIEAAKEAAKANNKQSGKNNNAKDDDNYEDEFEQLLDKDDEENEEYEGAEGKINASKKEGQNTEGKNDNGDENDEDYIDEEEMLDIAERCFVRIAEAILENGVSVRQAFNQFIIREEFEGEALELLSPIGFLEGVKELGVTDLEEVEVACLMRVLTKADLENAILLRELIVIMENFGIQDDEGGIDERSAEINDENPAATAAAESQSASKLHDASQAEDSSANKSGKKKKAKKGGAGAQGGTIDLSQLDEKSIKILAKLMLALMELNVSLYDFFDGAIYEQLVKTKTKQNVVEIIAAKDFFELLQKRGVRKSDKAHENLQKFLQLDPNYPHLIMLKKVAKALDEMAKNEELMEGILAAAVGADMEDDGGAEIEGGRVGGGEIEHPDDDVDGAGGNGERLGTIGEDGDEDKHIYDTNTQNNGTSGNLGDKSSKKLLEKGAVDADGQYDEDYEF